MPATPTSHPVLASPTWGDVAELVVIKVLLFVTLSVLPLRAVLWLIDRMPKKRHPQFGVLARKVSFAQGLKDTRRYNRLIRLNCLKRSLITLVLLRRYGVPAQFHLGVNPQRGKFAHAWVSSPDVALVPLLRRGQGATAPYATLYLHG